MQAEVRRVRRYLKDGYARLARAPIENRLTIFQEMYREEIAEKSTLLAFRILPELPILTSGVNPYRSGVVCRGGATKKAGGRSRGSSGHRPVQWT
ncbi:hypothetical protein CKO51_18920 [Rhodopirellula sp. SM50]|nr:hypothetical protein CKO51_18920 [Rhodopirellula sp. SM50]